MCSDIRSAPGAAASNVEREYGALWTAAGLPDVCFDAGALAAARCSPIAAEPPVFWVAVAVPPESRYGILSAARPRLRVLDDQRAAVAICQHRATPIAHTRHAAFRLEHRHGVAANCTVDNLKINPPYVRTRVPKSRMPVV